MIALPITTIPRLRVQAQIRLLALGGEGRVFTRGHAARVSVSRDKESLWTNPCSPPTVCGTWRRLLEVCLFGILAKLLGLKTPKQPRGLPSLDVSGSDYEGLRPSIDRISEILGETGVVRTEHIGWFAEKARAGYSNSLKSTMLGILRDGDLLAPDELRALGLRANRKLGNGFLKRIDASDIDAAIKDIEASILFATSEARKTFDLQRMEKLGITHVTLSSAQDERNTKIENPAYPPNKADRFRDTSLSDIE